MKKRKILSLIVAVLMVMSSCLPVLATVQTVNGLSYDDTSGNNVVTSTAQVQITDIPYETDSGLSFKTYQILWAKYDESTNTISYQLSDWAETALTMGSPAAYSSKAEAIAAVLASTAIDGGSQTTGQDPEEQTSVLNILAAYVTANSPSEYGFSYTSESTWSYSAAAAQGYTGTATATMAVGAYLVVPSANNMSFLNTMVSVNAETAGASSNQWTTSAKGAVLKGTVVSIDKQVKESTEDDNSYANSTDAQIGETVTYKLTVLVPQFDASIANSDITFKIVDTPEHVSIDLSSVTIKPYDGSGQAGSALTGGSDYIATGGGVNQNNEPQALTITLNDNYQSLFCANGTYPYAYVEITYNATVLSTAVSGSTGNKNTAELTYGHTGITSNNAEAKSKVYTYQATVLKYESGSSPTTGLYGAQFKIYTVDDLTNPATLTALTFVENSAGDYSIYTGTGTEVSTVTTDTSGNITITGLDSNTTYMIEEVVAPSGYSINSNVLTFVIEGTTGQVTGITSAIEYTDNTMQTTASPTSWTSAVSNNALALTLADTKLAAMPAAGGVGIIIFTVIGVALMIAAVFLLNSSKGKNKEQAQ